MAFWEAFGELFGNMGFIRHIVGKEMEGYGRLLLEEEMRW